MTAPHSDSSPDNERVEDDRLLGLELSDGKYRIEALIGSGSMGVVYKGLHVDLQRAVAIKVVTPHLMTFKKAAARFRREARAASLLTHPNLVRVLDFGIEDKLHYIVMEYLDGVSMADFLSRRGALMQDEIVELVEQICSGLATAHDKGILHRDIKPENIHLIQGRDDDGNPRTQVKITDFGIAKIFNRDGSGSSAPSLTGMGEVLGTPEYMAPEQANGTKLDHRADIYACGVLMFFMATGRLPFLGDTIINLIMQHLSDPPPAPSSLREDISPEFEAIILRALSKDRDTRFQTAREMRAALRKLEGKLDRASGIFALAASAAARSDEPLEELPGAFAPTQPGFDRVKTDRKSALDALQARDDALDDESFDIDIDIDGPTVVDDRFLAEVPTEDAPVAEVEDEDAPTVADASLSEHFKPSPPRASSRRLLLALVVLLALGALGWLVWPTSEEAAPPNAPPPAAQERQLIITSDPSGAEIHLNGLKVGNTPHTVTLETGAHTTLLIQQRGYRPWHRKLDPQSVEPRQHAVLDKAPAEGTLVIQTTPPGAAIRVNGSPTERPSPVVVPKLWVGADHDVVVTLPGHVPLSRTVSFASQDSQMLDLTLEPTQQGFLEFGCPECQLVIEGQPQPPSLFTTVKAESPLQVHVLRNGETVWTQTLVLHPGELMLIEP